jgi:hypothetical protein
MHARCLCFVALALPATESDNDPAPDVCPFCPLRRSCAFHLKSAAGVMTGMKGGALMKP